MNEITLRKDIKLNQQDYDTILATINTKQLCDELFSRDAKLVINQLHKQQKIELFCELTRENYKPYEIEQELNSLPQTDLPPQTRSMVRNFGLNLTIDALISVYGLKMILNTLSCFMEP